VKLSDFDFNLPKNLIAQEPARPRDHARLLVYDRESGHLSDDYFYNLENYLPAKTALVLNDSKVEKCRLKFGSTEVFVLENLDPLTVRALVRPGKKFGLGKTVKLTSSITAEVLAIDDEGVRTLKLSKKITDKGIDAYRLTPFPPYIEQNEQLSDEYQTVYADSVGSKAAPTAGLHFTPAQLAKLSINHDVIKVTLHVGLGTFAPVKDLNNHKLHEENFFVSAQAARQLNKASRLTAVGTTSLRTLESLRKPFRETSGSTDIFITPGYEFKNVSALVTNFHLPKSTLLMLVAAFVGSTDEVRRIYDYAIDKQYRFYSFGDAMLIL